MNDRITTRDDRRQERALSWGVLILLFIGCVVVIWPFKSALLWAIVLTFTTWPIYQRVYFALHGRRTLAALVMTIAIAVILLLPFLIAGLTMGDDVKTLTAAMRHGLESGPPDPPGWLVRIPLIGGSAGAYWQTFTGDSKQTLAAIKDLLEPASGLLLSGGLILGHGLLDLALSIFIAFFLYRDGGWVALRAKSAATRLAGERGEQMLVLAGNTIRGVVYGILGTAIVQGVVAGLGFLIARVPGAVVLALLTFVLSILPLGPPLIWIPVTIWLFHRGSTGWGVFMLIWGILVSSIDNVVKPWLISKGSDMPFILIFFGVIGGVIAFGFIGVFLGPTLLAVGYRLLQEWVTPPAKLVLPEADKPTLIT